MEDFTPKEEVPVIEDWDIGPLRAMEKEAVFVARLLGYNAIHGLIDGARIETKPISEYDEKRKEVILVNGSRVKLGEPKMDYADWCEKRTGFRPTKENPFREKTVFFEKPINNN